MAKKEKRKFTASIVKGNQKAAAWLCVTQLFSYDEQGHLVMEEECYSAWRNASAAKRCVKEEVQRVTPRKSVKLIAGETLDEKGKPTSFYGELEFKA